MAMQKRLAFLIAFSICALPLAAQAQRQSPLADAPAIRKRLELRSSRLELGAGAGATLNQDFFHSVFINVKLGFHITDWLSVSAFGSFAAANIDTGFKNNVVDSLKPPGMSTIPREPDQGQATASINKISEILGAQIEATPFTGKYSLFGKIFAHYDLYAMGGVGALNLVASSSNAAPACTDNGADRSCTVTGFKVGPTFGIGLHSYINQFLALNLELRDIFAPNNSAGRDVNGDGRANNADIGWGNTFVASLNVVLYLPSTADISN
jgi:outer membrane beta-barrel protein